MRKIILLIFLSLLMFSPLKSQKTYVPDDNFELVLRNLGYDSGPLDDSVLTSSIDTITYLSLYNENIASLIGIEDFLALDSLNCTRNQLTILDLSKNVNLKWLSCLNNQLTSLNLSKNTALTNLYCNFNQLTSLDLSRNTVLTEIYCEHNQLTSLNVKNGNNSHFSILQARFNPSLVCIQVDDTTYSKANWLSPSFKFDSQSKFNLNCGYPAPPCFAKFYPTQLTAGGVYLIDSTRGNDLKYKWYFGDGDSSSTYLPTHNYSSAGSYNVCLQITDTIGGCTDIFCDTIKVDSTGILRNSWILRVVKSSPVLSVEEVKVNKLNIYPNPTTGILNIDFENTGNYILFSIDGKEVLKNGELNTDVTVMDISGLNNGMYLFRIITEEGNILTKKIVKQ